LTEREGPSTELSSMAFALHGKRVVVEADRIEDNL
jgi:hypothetical protein